MGQTKKYLAKKNKTNKNRMNRGGAPIKTLKTLVDQDPNYVNARNYNGDTLLHLVCKELGETYDKQEREKLKEFAKYLIREGADINASNNDNKIPLFYITNKERNYTIFRSKAKGELPIHTIRREIKRELENEHANRQEALHTAFDSIEHRLGKNNPYSPQLTIAEFMNGVKRGGKSMNKKRRKTNKKRK